MIRPLRKSASLILFDNEKRLLVLKRRSQMSFANAYAFPGGVCETLDKNQAGNDSFPLYGRITAIRECFQQTGILLCPENINVQQILSSSQKDVIAKIGEMWKNHIQLLKPIIRLLTPQFPKAKRYDCIFYVPSDSVLKVNYGGFQKNQNSDPYSIEKVHFNEQSLDFVWQTASELLNSFQSEKIFLAPPQQMILTCLREVKKPQYLFQLDDKFTLQPIIVQRGDNQFLFPGDHEYFFDKTASNEPESESRAEFIQYYRQKEMKSHHRRISVKHRRYESQYLENNLFSFLHKKAKL